MNQKGFFLVLSLKSFVRIFNGKLFSTLYVSSGKCSQPKDCISRSWLFGLWTENFTLAFHSPKKRNEKLGEKWRDFKVPLHNFTVVNSLSMTSWNWRTRTHAKKLHCKSWKKKKFMSFPSRCNFAAFVSLSLVFLSEARKRNSLTPRSLRMCNRQTKVKTIAIYYFQNNLLTTVERGIPKKLLRNKKKIWGKFKWKNIKNSKNFAGGKLYKRKLWWQSKIFKKIMKLKKWKILWKNKLQVFGENEKKSHSEKISF